LTDVERPRTQVDQLLDDLALPAATGEVQVESRAGRRLARRGARGRLGHPLEAEVELRPTRDRESRLEAGWLVGQPLQAQARLPEATQPLGVQGVDDDVLQIHRFRLTCV